MRRLYWRALPRWIYLTWHPKRHASADYRALIAAAVRRAKLRMERKLA